MFLYAQALHLSVHVLAQIELSVFLVANLLKDGSAIATEDDASSRILNGGDTSSFQALPNSTNVPTTVIRHFSY